MQDTTERGSQPSVTDTQEDEAPLRDYVWVLWRGKWIVLGAALLCGVVTFAAGRMSSPVYEASVKMVVTPSRPAQAGEVTSPLTVATVRAIVENQSLAAQIVKEYHLDREPARLSPQAFLTRALVLETPRDTNMLVVRVRLPSRDLPAKVGNRLAELAFNLAERLSQEETSRLHDQVKAQLDRSTARLESVEGRLREFKEKAQIEVVEQDVRADLDARSDLRSLAVRIEAQRASIAKAEEELAKRQAIDTVRRTIDHDPGLMEAAKQTSRPDTGLLGLEVKNEYPNTVYQELDRALAESRVTLSGLEKEKAELIHQLGSNRLQKLNVLYSREAELQRLEDEHELANKVYKDIATRYEQVRLQVAGRSAQLQLLDAALPPDGPVGPRVRRNAIAAALAGGVLAAVACLFWAALSGARAAGAVKGAQVRQ